MSDGLEDFVDAVAVLVGWQVSRRTVGRRVNVEKRLLDAEGEVMFVVTVDGLDVASVHVEQSKVAEMDALAVAGRLVKIAQATFARWMSAAAVWGEIAGRHDHGPVEAGDTLMHMGTGDTAVLMERRPDDQGWLVEGSGGLVDWVIENGTWSRARRAGAAEVQP